MCGYCTLYSKQETQRCSRSSRRLICSTDKSDTQRSRRVASAFFSTHRKHTSRVLLHSADRELDWRPGWWRQTHKLSGSLNQLQQKMAVWGVIKEKDREPPTGEEEQLFFRKEQHGKNANTFWMTVWSYRKARVIFCQTEAADSHTVADLWPVSL